MTPYQRACANAIQVQDACNPSGIILSLAEDMAAVRDQMRADGTFSTDALAKHPVILLYLDKLCDLAGYDPGTGGYGAAYNDCAATVRAACAAG